MFAQYVIGLTSAALHGMEKLTLYFTKWKIGETITLCVTKCNAKRNNYYMHLKRVCHYTVVVASVLLLFALFLLRYYVDNTIEEFTYDW